MSRELKFKAFYKPLKIMIQPEHVESINFDTKVVGVYFDHEGRGYHKLRMSDFVLLQYTGLKDRNGVEIYEGDIIQVKGHPFEGSIKIDGNYEVGFNDRMELCAGSWLLHRMLYCSEVIGNIHDNPELLEASVNG